MKPEAGLLTDPFLQLPTEDSVRVVWFTDYEGEAHHAVYGARLERTVAATTTRLTRLREDRESHVGAQHGDGSLYSQPTPRDVWRHEAVVRGLTPGERVAYRVVSVADNGERVESDVFMLSCAPPPGMPLKILLTSDHQMESAVAANMQKVVEIGHQIDAVFHAGDLVNTSDRASEWFDDNRGVAFFPAMQGRAHAVVERAGAQTAWRGAPVLQSAPLFTAIGNHEVMGRFSIALDLAQQRAAAYPRAAAKALYRANEDAINPRRDPQVRERWLRDNTFNTVTYEELFTLPQSAQGGARYYAVTLGDVRLVVLYATRVWRPVRPSADGAVIPGKYSEHESVLNDPGAWGYGEHIFEPVARGSAQYAWLQEELDSPAFRAARIKVVMLHHPMHSLGAWVVPPFTDPVQTIDRDAEGRIQAVRYGYPIDDDYLIRDVEPLLEAAGVNLVLTGHCHLWNRFLGRNRVRYLETSHVGSTHGAYVGQRLREAPVGYITAGDPYHLLPVLPRLAPRLGDDGNLLPYIADPDLSVFSILDTGTRQVSSYYFDLRHPGAQPVLFDMFHVGHESP